MSLLNMIARKGRKGDSRVNIVDGELAHVNPIEDEAIKALGPMGEAFTKAVGSGGINPKTGLREYSWLSKRLTPSKKMKKAGSTFMNVLSGDASLSDLGTDIYQAGKQAWNQSNPWIANKDVAWRPSQGKWGIFGQTEGAKKTDAKRKVLDAKKDMFESYMEDYKDANIAGMQTPSTEDTPGQGAPFEGKFDDFLTASGIIDSAEDINKVTKYDTRKEDELTGIADRALQNQNINLAREGDKNSAQMFGLLTQSNTSDSQKNFAGSGNFAMDFAKKQAVDDAEAELEQATLSREDIFAGLEGDVADLHDAYNTKFWGQMMDLENKLNS